MPRLVGVPRQQQNQQYDRSYIEKTNTPDHAIDGFWHHRLWIFALPSGGTDQFNRRKSEHYALNQYQRGQQAVREKAAIICNQVKTGGITLKRLTGTEKNRAYHQEDNNGEYFYQREPELHFGKPFYADHVHGTDNG